jgi:hypothetical protein
MIPGWPYSVIAALESGRTSWTLTLDAVRLGPADDATEVTAAQVRQVAERIIACYAQLCLARGLAADIRLPWQRPSPPGQLTPPGSAAGSATSARHSLIWPARRNPANPTPAGRPDPRTDARAIRHDVGKTVKRDDSKKKDSGQKAK